MPRRKVAGPADYIIPLAVVGGVGLLAYFLVTKLGSALTSANTQNSEGTTAANTSAAAASQAQATAAGITPTLTPNQMASIANNVYNLGVNNPTSATPGLINNQLDLVNNIADLNGVISAFGTKNIATSTSWTDTCYTLGLSCTAVGLAAFVDQVYQLDTTGEALATLNEFLSDQGINFQF